MPVDRTNGSPPGDRRRLQTLLFSFAFVALVVVAASGFVWARGRADLLADRRVSDAADRAGVALVEAVRSIEQRQLGAQAIVRDGTLDLEVFGAFADDVLEGSDAFALGLVAVVEGDERASFEELTGLQIRSIVGSSLAAAPAADRYLPLVAGRPGELTDDILGFDLGSDPTRRAALDAAATSGEPFVSEVVQLAADQMPAVLVIRPLVPGGRSTPVAFLASALPIDSVVARARAVVPDDVSITVLAGDDTIVAGPEVVDEGRIDTADASSVGLEWRVVARSTRAADLRSAWIVAGLGLFAVVTLGALAVATSRHQRQLAASNALLVAADARNQAVQRIAARLARALSGGQVVDALLDHLPTAVGAGTAVIGLVDGNGDLELLGRGARGEAAAIGHLAIAGTGSVIEQALAGRESVWLSSPLGWRGDEAATELVGAGQALAVVPLAAADVRGVLAVSYPRLHVFDEEEQSLLGTVAVLGARAISRGRRYDAEHRAAVEFQRAALPSALPVFDGLSIAARYRPAARQATVGGDWYDVIVLDDHRVVCVVGDVVGHGMAAAAAMGRLRTAFQAIVDGSGEPGEMIARMGRQADLIPNAFCTTLVVAVVDTRDGSVTWTRAGHPPPLVVGPDGARLLEGPGSPPLGVVPDAEVPVHRCDLGAEECLVLYTDGVVERRDESLDEGFERLRRVAADLADLPPASLVDVLVQTLVPEDEQSDDIAVLAVCLPR